MKYILSMALVLVSMSGVYAHTPVVPRPVPASNYAQGYHNGYNHGYNNGRDDHREKVWKAVGATVLVGIGAVIIYEVAKECNRETRLVPTQNGIGYRF